MSAAGAIDAKRPASSSVFEVDSELLWNKSDTGKTEKELQCLDEILRAGDPDAIPHINKKVAKQLNKKLLHSDWPQPAHSQKFLKNKLRFGKWKQVENTAQPTLCRHSLLLKHDGQYVLPCEEWQLAADAALQRIQLSPSLPETINHSQYVRQILQIFRENSICTLSRQCGVSEGFVNEYVSQLQVHSSAAERQVSTHARSQLPALYSNESEVHFVCQPNVSQSCDPATFSIEQQLFEGRKEIQWLCKLIQAAAEEVTSLQVIKDMVAGLQRVIDSFAQQSVTAANAPPMDTSLVEGTVAEASELQSRDKRKATGSPDSNGTSPKRCKAIPEEV